ncbi:MAG: acylneuraminate cytidylyltransferase family protein [Proteobacteria bacterium]|nr:acylneuraminate cytidylyltransferase family protein [Pseudomonadota bacterium]
MRLLALITARGGSKRVPGKNIRPLGGAPLLVWSVRAVNGVPEICDTLVSTDSAEIAQVARDGGALVPWLRPPELSTDFASSADVCLHALNWYESVAGAVDGLLLLQPTSPFRSRDTIIRGIELFRSHERRPVIGVSPAASHPLWCFRVEGDELRPFLDGERHIRSQDLPAAFVLNGSFYLVTPQQLRARGAFYHADAVPLVSEDPAEGIDIDTEWDWLLAQAVASARGAVLR